MDVNAVSEWLEKAREDDLVVDLIIANGGPWAMAAYHLQQVAEKSLKALLVHRDIAPPRSHDLGFLLGRLPGEDVPENIFSAADEVSAYAWLTRYPGAPEVTRENVESIQDNVRLVKDFVARSLGN